MSTDLERALREAMHFALDPVQPPPGLAEAAASRGRVRRRHSSIRIAGTAASVLAVAVGATVFLQRSPVTTVVLPGSQPSSAVRTGPPPPAGQQAVSFHGIQVFVPDDWSFGVGCGGTQLPAVVFDDGAVPACLPPRPTVTVVHLRRADTRGGQMYAALATEPGAVDGEAVRRGRGSVVPGSSVVDVLYVPQVEALVVVDNASQSGFDVFGGVHFAEVDRVGCRDRISSLMLPGAVRAGADKELLPVGADQVTVCRYTGGWLMRSARLSATDRATLEQQAATAPGTPQQATGARCSSEQPHGLVLHATYPDGDAVDLSAQLDGCPWQISNGSVTRGLTQTLMTVLTKDVGYDGSLGNALELPEG